MITVPNHEEGQRLDRFIAKHNKDLSYVAIQKMIRTGQVRVDGKRAKPNVRLCEGQEVRLPISSADTDKPALNQIQRQDLEDLFLYRDDQMVVLNKPAGLAVQGGSKTRTHLDGLLQRWAQDQDIRPRLVHRLDKETSGIFLVAFTRAAAHSLTRQFADKTIQKIYWACVMGKPVAMTGEISHPLTKTTSHVQVDPDQGKPAITTYDVLEYAGKKAAWLSLSPQQGRTHQLRVHTAAEGFPIYGDAKYGDAGVVFQGDATPGLHLHCRQMTWTHPITHQKMSLTAPLPPHMQATWELFGWAKDAK